MVSARLWDSFMRVKYLKQNEKSPLTQISMSQYIFRKCTFKRIVYKKGKGSKPLPNALALSRTYFKEVTFGLNY